MDKKYIINISGKDFVKHEGLLNEFHENGGKEIKTKLIQYNEGLGMFIFKAIVTGESGVFTAHGDASTSNVNRMIAPHLMRMAETRAVNRALRFYNNVGMCSADELGGDSTPQKQSTTTSVKGVPCNKCKNGQIVQKNGPSGMFYACNSYPQCRNSMDTEVYAQYTRNM